MNRSVDILCAGRLTFCQYIPVRWFVTVRLFVSIFRYVGFRGEEFFNLIFALVCYISVTSLPVCVLSFFLVCVLFPSNINAHLGIDE